MKHFKPIVTLALIATIVPELLTVSTPLTRFLSPIFFLWLLASYGVAVLVIREFTVRNGLGYGGVFAMGLAYSIFNEGFLAKTMVIFSGSPIPAFDNYGYLFGLNLPNLFFIAPWHALSSVLTPILLTYYLFPSQRDVPWLGKKTVWGITVVLLFFAIIHFLGPVRVPGTLPQLATLSGLMLACIFCAKKMRTSPIAEAGARNIGWGPVRRALLIFPFTLILFAIASLKLPAILFIAAVFVGVWFFIWSIKRKGWLSVNGLALFGLGSYMQTALLGIIFALASRTPGYPLIVATGVIAEGILLVWAYRITHAAVEPNS